jgi:hypothetical protein
MQRKLLALLTLKPLPLSAPLRSLQRALREPSKSLKRALREISESLQRALREP